MKDFYAYKGIGSEIDTDAAWEYIRQGYLLGPRTVLKGRTKIPQLKLPTVPINLNKLSVEIQSTLLASLGDIAGSSRAIMFSGGFDSMLIACLAQRCGAKVTAVTVGFDDFNPLTVTGSTQIAHKMGVKHHILYVKAVEFFSAFETLASVTDEPVLDLELAIVYAALKKYDPLIAGKVFISGMGSDQWLGDHALEAKRGNLAVRLDWANVNEDAHQRVAQVHGCDFVFPFLSGPMLAFSQLVPPAMKKDKKLLRELAVVNTIPPRGIRSEIQVPSLLRRILVKKYGDRAWPSPVSLDSKSSRDDTPLLRQIMLGLWLEKRSIK